MSTQKFTTEIEQELDKRWIAEVLELPGVVVYGIRQFSGRCPSEGSSARSQSLGRPPGAR